jgi:hypothetical protein
VENHSESKALPSSDCGPLQDDDFFWLFVRRGLAEYDRRREARLAAEAAAHQENEA